MQRLGKNLGSYLGETIDIRAVLRDVETAAQQHGWTGEVFHESGGFKWLALHRAPRTRGSALPIYISTGIHGDEPAGPLAALRLLQENNWPENLEIFLLPCLNPIGFTLNKRENAGGVDLNRDYRDPKAAETRAHIAWLERQPKFDFHLCLHEDWESHGFYLYDASPESQASLADKVIKAVEKVCPIDLSENIEGRAAKDGIVRPKILPLDRPDWPEAFYLITNKSEKGFTIEAPSDFSITTRVDALIAAVNTTINNLA